MCGHKADPDMQCTGSGEVKIMAPWKQAAAPRPPCPAPPRPAPPHPLQFILNGRCGGPRAGRGAALLALLALLAGVLCSVAP